MTKRFSKFLSLLILFLSLLFAARVFCAEIEQIKIEKAASQKQKKPPQEQVHVAADDLQFEKDKRNLMGVGNVVVTRGNLELNADQIQLNVDTKESWANGHVVLQDGSQRMLSGKDAYYDFNNKKGRFKNVRFFQFPWYGFAEDLQQVSENKLIAKNAYLTTCDYPHGHDHYDIYAKDITIYPGDKLVAKNITFRILQKPVFWLPYLVVPLDYNSFVQAAVGYSGSLGAYVLLSKSFSVNKNIKGKLHADYYSKRGAGLGADFEYKFDHLGIGEVKLYGIQDKRAPDDRSVDPYASNNIKTRDRGRMSWKHKMKLDDKTVLQAQWYELSDNRVLQDFFEREYREEIDPQSFVTVTRNDEKYSVFMNVEKRTNRFSTVAEKLPEVIFNWIRRPLFGTNFYYANQEGYVNFDQTTSFSKTGPATDQFYTGHELSYPLRILKFYNFVPYINFRDDMFTKDIERKSVNRLLVGGGVDALTKFYGTWDVKSNFAGLNINGLRHIIMPVVQYNTVQLSTQKPTELVQTGNGTNIGLQDIMTFGLENRIQTKKKVGKSLQRVDLVSFNAYLDYSFGPGNDMLPTRKNEFTEARVQIILRPYDWFSLRMDSTYNMVTRAFASNTLDAIFNPGPLQITVQQSFLKSGPSWWTTDGVFVNGTSNQLTLDGLYTLNHLWSVGGYVRYEFSLHQWQEWEIRAHRDLHDWLLDFGLNFRNKDMTLPSQSFSEEVFVELRLKAYPRISLKSGHRASYVEPRIGQTVSGANDAPLPDWVNPNPGSVPVQPAAS